ncbi:MAG: AAA family ATPase [Phycisphaerae bacterium]
MLRRLKTTGFKSILDVDMRFPQLTVLFGPNAAGKSNLLDAIQSLSRAGTERTLSDAMSEPIRGYPVESFAFPPGGLSALLGKQEASFELEADLGSGKDLFRYRVQVAIQPSSGGLSVKDEYLTALSGGGEPRGTPSIERIESQIRIRRKSKPAHPRQEPVGLNHTILSDPRLGGVEYRPIEKCRSELTGWRVYYLDPRLAMRAAKPPAEVTDIGVTGENIAPFLYRLRAERPKHFDAIKRTMRSIVPSVEGVDVDLDKRRGTLDVLIRQNGTDFSSRIVSEGTLRVLALCSIAVNPWGGSLIAFEEPENGVHPRRLELIARLLISLATEQGRQVVVTTHSPLFCDAVLKERASRREEISLFNVRRVSGKTAVRLFDYTGPLLGGQDIDNALTAESEDGLFENLLMRGLLDE